jgi:hypothetical protein
VRTRCCHFSEGFHQYSRRLTRYFIILLPPLEPEAAEIEIDEYRAALAGVPGVLCVTEGVADARFHASYHGEVPPISAHLRYLNHGESRRLVAGWPRAPKEGDGLPIIREEDLSELEDMLRKMNVNITLGKLLTALRAIYENSAGAGDRSTGGEDYVAYAELVKAYLAENLRG